MAKKVALYNAEECAIHVKRTLFPTLYDMYVILSDKMVENYRYRYDRANPFCDDKPLMYNALENFKNSLECVDFGPDAPTFDMIKNIRNPFVHNVERRRNDKNHVSLKIKGLANTKRAHKVFNMIEEKQ